MNNVVDVEEIELEPHDPESSSVTDGAEISADAAKDRKTALETLSFASVVDQFEEKPESLPVDSLNLEDLLDLGSQELGISPAELVQDTSDTTNNDQSPATRETARSLVFKQDEAHLWSQDSIFELESALRAERKRVELDKQGAEYRKRLTAIPVHHKAKSCWTMGYFIDYAIHVNWLGRFIFALLVLLPPVNYGKDYFVAYLCWDHDHKSFFWATMLISTLSSRLLLMTYFDLESIRPKKFLLYLIPGSVCLDYKLEEWTDVAVWLICEMGFLLMTPFCIFFLLYLSFRRVLHIFQCVEQFDGSYTLAFNVIELLFETIPQFTLQLILYFKLQDNTVPTLILEIGIFICGLSLVKIPLTLIWNWSLILNNRLIFKRHHDSVVKAVKFHPTRDVLASGSWDRTVLFHAVLTGSMVKAKRVASCGSMQINCICFTRDGTKMAAGGHGLRIWDDMKRKFTLKLPTRKKGVSKRPRGAEISHISFSPDNRFVFCAEGPSVSIYDIESGELVQRPYCIEQNANQGPALGVISAMALSPTGKILLTSSTTDTDIYVWTIDNRVDVEGVNVHEKAHSQTINCLAFTRDSRYFLTGSSDNTVKIWNIEDPEEIKFVMKYSCDTEIISLAVGAMVESFEEHLDDETVKEFMSNVSNESMMGDGLKTFESSSYCAPPVFTPVEYLRIGRPILVTGGISTVTVYDLVNGEELAKWENIEGVVNSVDVSPYGEFVAFGTDRYEVGLRSLNEIIKVRAASKMEIVTRS